MQYPDLSPYVHEPRHARIPTVSVGWLDRGSDFATGNVHHHIPALLWQCCRRVVVVKRGRRNCPLCETRVAAEFQGETLILGGGEIRVFAAEIAYAAPDLIFHFVTAHHYSPPPAFIEALRQQPVAWSGEYASLLGTAVAME